MTNSIEAQQDRVYAFLKDIPFANHLDFQCRTLGDEMTCILPFQPKLIGNPAINALHGGVIGAFLELTAMSQLFLLTDTKRYPKPINLTIDYLRQGKAQDLHARATVTKKGRRIANVKAEAWQSERDRPVATLLAHFLIAEEN